MNDEDCFSSADMLLHGINILQPEFRDPSEEKLVENFLDEEGIEETKKTKILTIINGMGQFPAPTFYATYPINYNLHELSLQLSHSVVYKFVSRKSVLQVLKTN